MTAIAEPLYAAVAERLRHEIASGRLQRGAWLHEQKLADKHGVARGTARRAIEELVAEGLIVSVDGRGHQVRERLRPLVWRASDPERNASSDKVDGPADAWSRSVRAQGREPSEDIRTEIIYADVRVATWLQLETGEPVSVRRRIRYVDGEPYATADSFYPRSIVAGTEVELPGDVLPGIYAVFERIGRPWVRTPDQILSRNPSREEARILHIPRGQAVTEIVRRSYDRDGIPVRLTLFVLPGDRHVIEYEHQEEPQ